MLLLVFVCACASRSESKEAAAPSTARAPIQFEFEAADGRKLDSASTRGRVTAILVLATYDLASQLVAQRLEDAMHKTRPRINAGAIALEPPTYSVLLETFRSSLNLTYPVVLADAAMLSGQGPFGSITFVPTLVVLDSEGRVVSQEQGPLTDSQILGALDQAAGKKSK